jgi:hypothetical protein
MQHTVEGKLEWSHPVWELHSKTRYSRKDEGRIEAIGRRRRKCKQLLYDLKEMSY